MGNFLAATGLRVALAYGERQLHDLVLRECAAALKR